MVSFGGGEHLHQVRFQLLSYLLPCSRKGCKGCWELVELIEIASVFGIRGGMIFYRLRKRWNGSSLRMDK